MPGFGRCARHPEGHITRQVREQSPDPDNEQRESDEDITRRENERKVVPTWRMVWCEKPGGSVLTTAQTSEQQEIDEERGVQSPEQPKNFGTATGLTKFGGAEVTASHTRPEKTCWLTEPSCKKRSGSAKLSQLQQCSSGITNQNRSPE